MKKILDHKEDKGVKILEYLGNKIKDNREALEIAVGQLVLGFNTKLKKVRSKARFYISRQELKELISEANLKHMYIPNQEVFLDIDRDPIRIVNYATVEEIFSQAGLLEKLRRYRVYERMFDQSDLKNLSEFMKMAGPKADPDWRLFVNIETLFGWRQADQGEQVWAKVLDWIDNDFKPTLGRLGDEVYYAWLEDAAREMLRSGHKVRDPMSLEEFCSNIPMMGTAGSSFCPEDAIDVRIMFKGDEIGFDKNKYAMTLSMTLGHRIARMTEKRRQKAKVSTKMEFFPKQRIIVSGDYWTSMKMRFIRQWLDLWLEGTGWSTLWQSSEQNLDMWTRLATLEGKKVPIDQSAFDHHAVKRQLRTIMNVIRELLVAEATEEYVTVMDAVMYAMEEGLVIYKSGDKIWKHKWVTGILSGWDWTALLDTMLNYCQYLIAKRLCREEYGIVIETKEINVQGDDQNFVTATWTQALAYWAAMDAQNLDVNPQKNFFSEDHNEYLRKGGTSEGINGYPMRMVNGMCWVYPGSRDKYDNMTKMKNICDNWEKLGQRMGCNLDKLMVQDLKGAKIPRVLYSNYKNAPDLWWYGNVTSKNGRDGYGSRSLERFA